MYRMLGLACVASVLFLAPGVASAQGYRPLNQGRLPATNPAPFGNRAYNAVNDTSRYTGMQINSRTTATASPSGITIERRPTPSAAPNTTFQAGTMTRPGQNPFAPGPRSYGASINYRW